MKINNALAIVLAAFAVTGAYVAQPLVKADTANVQNAVNTETKEKCQKALDALDDDLNIDLDNVLANVRLTYLGLYNSSISWTSSNVDVIVIKTTVNDNGKTTGIIGTVTRPDADTNVTLTATAQIGTDTESIATREFKLVVKAKVDVETTVLPLKMEEDFSDYKAGLDISNYYKWQMTSGEDMISEIIDKDNDTNLSNINNLPADHVLKISSGKQASDICYTRKINANSVNAVTGAVLEGYVLTTGNTNGVQIEMVSSAGVVGALKITSSSYAYILNGNYVNATGIAPKEGVWTKFRFIFRPAKGLSLIQIYNWNTSFYYDITAESTSAYIANKGVASGTKGDVVGLRIRSKSGSKSGATYLSNLNLDTPDNLPETPSAGIVDPNRTNGIGTIDNYESEILAYTGSTPSALSPNFHVHNRFDESIIYTKGSDYTVSDAVVNTSKKDGYSVVTYTYTFTLTATKETKAITQTVYFDEELDTAKIYGFKASYLKAVTGSAALGQITLTGNVVRSDSTMYYMIMDAGSTAPSADQIIAGTAITGTKDAGNAGVSSSSFSVTTASLAISKEYDAYVVTKNANGVSAVYKSVSISTVINIADANDFYLMGTNIDTAASSFRMINDVDMSEFEWTEASSITFTGIFDGQGYKVSGLRINLPASKVGIFQTFKGSFSNVTLDEAYISGLEDVGVIGGNFYDGAKVSNVNFNSCKVDQEAASTGGGGYFGIIAGRMRRGGESIKNVSIKDAYVDCPKYCGLMTGGIEAGDSSDVYTVENIYAEGSVYTDGAAVGLIGRNRSTTNITNAIISLNIKNAKKEVGVVAGHNKEGGKLNVNKLIGDLKVQQMTQPTYFNNFIGSFDSNTSSYTATDVYFIDEDYSDLGDNIVPTTSTVDAGTTIYKPDEMSEMWWETNTYLRNFDTNLVWAYDSATGLPYLNIRTAADISITAEDVVALIGKIDTEKILANHYYIYKATEDIAVMSATEKAKISQTDLNKLATAKEAYEDALTAINGVITGIGAI